MKMNKILVFIVILLVLFSTTSESKAASSLPQLSNDNIKQLTSGPDLFFGQKGDEVIILQVLLARQGRVIYPEQTVSGYFGPLTKAALVRFQKEYKILPASGYFGSISKRYVTNHGVLYVTSTEKSGTATSFASQLTAGSSSPAIIDSNVNAIVSSGGIKSSIDYVNMLIDVSKKIKITDEDLNGTKKVSSLPLALPGLLEWALSGRQITDQELISTANFWEKIAAQTQNELEQKSVSQSMANYHKTMIGWFRYNKQVAEELASLKVSDPSIKSIFDQYVSTYKKYGSTITNRLKLSELDKVQLGTNWDSFFSKLGLIKVANAVGGIPFGGIITITDLCLSGELLAVSAPAPGLFFLYWPIYFANPFLYNIVITGNWILGEALPGPGVCNKTLVNYPEGEGVILYFGTGLQ